MRKLRHHEIDRLSSIEFKRIRKHPITVLVQDVRSIHNVGSMFRSADAAAVERLVLCGITGSPQNRAIRKTALGAEESVEWTSGVDALEVIRDYRDRGYTVAALELTDEPSTASDLATEDFPLLLVVGNEVHGLSDELIVEADLAIEIPQFGTKQSLNVAVAFGIAIFSIVGRYREIANRQGADTNTA
jgi:tRNA G18 (ribose-2'-O)-methylase SpoU